MRLYDKFSINWINKSILKRKENYINYIMWDYYCGGWRLTLIIMHTDGVGHTADTSRDKI